MMMAYERSGQFDKVGSHPFSYACLHSGCLSLHKGGSICDCLSRPSRAQGLGTLPGLTVLWGEQNVTVKYAASLPMHKLNRGQSVLAG